MFIGAILMGMGFILLSRLNSLLLFYAVFIIFKGIGSGLVIIAIQVALVNWFRKRRALSMGIALGGFNIGAMAVPVVVLFIASYGWRGAALIIGLTMLAVQIPLSFVLRRRPEDYGYLPDGMTEPPAGEAETLSPGEPVPAEQEFTPGQAVRTRTFWFINIAYGARTLITAAIPIHLIAFIQDLGYSATIGGSIMALMGFCALLGRVGLGYLADIMPKRFIFAACLAGMGISSFILASANSVWHLVLWAVIYGPSYGGGSPAMGAMVGDYYGRRYFGTINGLTHIVMTVTTVAGSVFAGYVFDVTGSYQVAFNSFVVVCSFGAAAAILATRPPRLPVINEGTS
jgi:MFS family permease